MIFSCFTCTVSTSSFASPFVIHPLLEPPMIRCVTIVSFDNRKLTISPVSTSPCNVSTMMMLPTGSSGAMEALMIKKIRKRQRPYAVRNSSTVKIHTFLVFTFLSLQRSLPGCCRMHPFFKARYPLLLLPCSHESSLPRLPGCSPFPSLSHRHKSTYTACVALSPIL